jgi:hypothetical protein
MLFRNGGDFGIQDPQFHIDIGFYVFEFPFWRYLLDVGLIATSLVGARWGSGRRRPGVPRLATPPRRCMAVLVLPIGPGCACRPPTVMQSR